LDRCRQGCNAVRPGHVAAGQLDLDRHRRVRKQRLDFRAEDQPARVLVVEQRLLSGTVAREHETALADKLNAQAKSLSALAEGGALHRVVPSMGSTVDDLVRRLREQADEPEHSRTPLTVEQTTSAGSILDGEVARIVAAAFEAHRNRLMTSYGWITSPIESGTSGSAWRVAGVVPGSAAELGDVLLVYGAPDLVRQAVTAFLASTVPTRRLAIVNVLLASTDSPWEPQRDAVLAEWRTQLDRDLAERTLISAVPLDEGLPAGDAAERWTDATADEVIVAWPEEALARVRPDHATAVVVLTHDDKFDLPALVGTLATDAFYIGALGSRRNQEKRRERLLEAGVAEDALERIHGPAGLDIGAHSPAETAVSMLSEILAVRASRSGGPLREAKTRIHADVS